MDTEEEIHVSKNENNRNERRSDYLITITSLDEASHSSLERLLARLNEKIFSLVISAQPQFIPRFDFARFQGSAIATNAIVGCADEKTADWIIREVKEFDVPLQVWDGRAMFVVHIPAPTSQMANEVLIKAIKITNDLRGRMVVLKSETTKTGKDLVVGTDEDAVTSLRERNFEAHCGLFRLLFQPNQGPEKKLKETEFRV